MNDMASTIIPEEWREVVGFPEYAVSSYGRIKRVIPGKKNHACRVLKPWSNNKGYLLVSLCGAALKRKKQVSQMVCEAFHGPKPTPLHEVAHNDGDPGNNRKNNLRWATRKENMADCVKHGTQVNGARHFTATNPEKIARGERHGHAILLEAQVKQIRATKKINGSGRALAEKFGVSPATICVIRNGKTWRHV